MAGKSLGLEPKVEKHFAWSNWHIKHYVLGYAKESDTIFGESWLDNRKFKKEGNIKIILALGRSNGFSESSRRHIRRYVTSRISETRVTCESISEKKCV